MRLLKTVVDWIKALDWKGKLLLLGCGPIFLLIMVAGIYFWGGLAYFLVAGSIRLTQMWDITDTQAIREVAVRATILLAAYTCYTLVARVLRLSKGSLLFLPLFAICHFPFLLAEESLESWTHGTILLLSQALLTGFFGFLAYFALCLGARFAAQYCSHNRGYDYTQRRQSGLTRCRRRKWRTLPTVQNGWQTVAVGLTLHSTYGLLGVLSTLL